MLLLGPLGSGKTVLLNEIGRQAGKLGYVVSTIELPENASLAGLLYPQMQKALLSLASVKTAETTEMRGLGLLLRFASIFQINHDGVEISIDTQQSIADSGNFETDLSDLFGTIGEAAKEAGKGWLLLIDEVQCLSVKDLSALIAALHRINQQELPVMFVGAGLPYAAKKAGDAKPYAERLFKFCSLA